MKRQRLAISAAIVVSALTVAGTLHAQQGPPDGERRGDGARQRGEGGWQRGEWRERMNERMREALGVSEEEWKVLQPRIEKVNELQRDLRGGMGVGFGRGPGSPGGPGGPGPRGNAQDASPVAKAATDLRETLDNADASAEQVSERLKALRDAREAAQEQLDTAREDLRGLLTQRHESSLVLMGVLE